MERCSFSNMTAVTMHSSRCRSNGRAWAGTFTESRLNVSGTGTGIGIPFERVLVKECAIVRNS
jgi:hypothetical protein